MKQSLPLLIEHARSARDLAARQNESALAAVRESQATVTRLKQYRIEYLAASPGANSQAVGAASLAAFHDFVARLDMAIRLQNEESARRTAVAARTTQNLLERQQRLFAFEALMTRTQNAMQLVAARMEQRNSDEFAARLFRSAAAGGTP